METSMIDRFKELYSFRHMFFGLVKKDFKGRYRNSVFGYLWHLITPLSMIIVFVIVFSAILGKNIESYWIYLSVGLFPWTFFSSSLNLSTDCIVRNSHMVNKMYFPREILIMSSVTTNLISLIISYSMLIVAIVISGHGINAIALLIVPIVLILEVVFVTGLGLIMSALNVYYRDISHGVGILTFLWMWVTPIMYTMDSTDSLLGFVNHINPMTYFIEIFHDIMYFGTYPEMQYLIICTVLAVIAVFVGMIMFKKLEHGFSERL